MKTNKLTLFTVATIATATLGIKGVNADESDRGITPETTTIATNQSGEANGTESAIPATKQINQQILTMQREQEALKLRITNEKDFQQLLKRAGM